MSKDVHGKLDQVITTLDGVVKTQNKQAVTIAVNTSSLHEQD